MTCQIDIKKKVPWKRRGVQMTDTDMNNLSLYLEKNYGLTSDRVIAKAIDIVANDNSFHPIIDLLESLKWDGRPRIAGMLTHFFGAENPEYSGEVMKMHMLAAISRLYEPGKKYDIMLCLVGGQGTGKSTFFKYLAIQDEWFTDDVKRLDDKKVYEYLQGHWIVEMSEMNAVANAKSIEETKSFLSRQKDTYRIPYERRAEDRYRQCVFCGTSNDLAFLPFDRTGNRRFGPVKVCPEKAETTIYRDEKGSREYHAGVGRGNGNLPKRGISPDLLSRYGRLCEISAEGLYAGRYTDRDDPGFPGQLRRRLCLLHHHLSGSVSSGRHCP